MIVIVIALALAVQQSAPVSDDEIVVIGRRLKDWRAKLAFKKGVAQCRITKSTGDPDIDGIGCDSMTQCFTALKPRIDALADKTLNADRRKQIGDAVNHDLTACFKEKRETLVMALADRRAAARNRD